MLKDFFDKIPYSRFDLLMQLNSSLLFKKPEITGYENLTEIPKETPLIVVTSHFSDADLQVVAGGLQAKLQKIRPDRKLAISCQSENFADFLTAFFIKLAGKKHFFGIDARFDKIQKRLRFTFNPNNFKQMAEALLKKQDIIIAAHEPLSNISNSVWALPVRAGLGAAFLAQIADAIILPVVVDIKTNEPVGMSGDFAGVVKRLFQRGRPQVGIVIGKPFFLEKVNENDLDLIGPFLKKKASGLKVKPEEKRIKSEQVFKTIIEQGNIIMRALAFLLPTEKRGGW